jgi:hypothetical protein
MAPFFDPRREHIFQRGPMKLGEHHSGDVYGIARCLIVRELATTR